MLGIVAFLVLAPVDRLATLESLVRAEKDFCADGLVQGGKKAFLKVLAPDSVLLNYPIAKGRELYESVPENANKLVWEPSFADVSADGQLGYTSGPWTLTGTSNEGKAFELHGAYLSVWRRKPDSTWELLADGGASAPKAVAKSSLKFGEPTKVRLDQDEGKRSLVRAEDLLAKGELDHALASDVVLLRDATQPIRGRRAAETWYMKAGKPVFTPGGTVLAPSNDLAFTYGVGARDEWRFGYFRIWKLDAEGDWRLRYESYSRATKG